MVSAVENLKYQHFSSRMPKITLSYSQSQVNSEEYYSIDNSSHSKASKLKAEFYLAL